MSKDLTAIISTIMIVATIAVITALMFVIVRLWLKHKDKRYKNLISDNPLLSKKIRHYESKRELCNFKLRVLTVKESRCGNLRNKILTSLPEEKEELYAEIKKDEAEIKSINEKVTELYYEWEKAYDDVIKYAAETLKPKDYKFFCKHGGWEQDESS